MKFLIAFLSNALALVVLANAQASNPLKGDHQRKRHKNRNPDDRNQINTGGTSWRVDFWKTETLR